MNLILHYTTQSSSLKHTFAMIKFYVVLCWNSFHKNYISCIDYSQLFYPFIKLHLNCILGLKEMSVKLMHNVLVDNG